MKNVLRNQNGFILFYTLFVLGILCLTAETYFIVETNHLRMSSHASDSIHAYYAADAGLADAFMQLKASVIPPAALNVVDNNYPVAGNNQTGSYNVQVTNDGAAWPVYTLTSTGTYHNVAKTLILRVIMTSYSKYGYLSSTEIDPVWGGNWYITGMISTGPTHTNGQFNMYGTPVFTDMVSQVSPAVNYWSGPPADNPDFQKGLTVNAPALNLPTPVSMDGLKTAAAQAQGLSLKGNSTITLMQDGTMNVTNANKAWVNHNIPIPANSALYVTGGSASVQGVLKGKLTIGAENNINISGNIVYKTDPRTDPTSTDMLGLVAQNNAIVTNNGPFNIEIDAYIVALSGQFLVNNFWTFLKGDMIQFGGLTSKLPGGLTGIFNPWTGQMVAGYNQLQYFDTRFHEQVPAWFTPLKDTSNRIVYTKLSLTEI